MTTMDRNTGAVLTGWPEVQQGLLVCLTTVLGERVYRRRFGRREADALDRPMNEFEIVNFIMSIIEAIRPRVINGFQYGEPRFELVRVIPSGTAGNIQFDCEGIYYPRGHLGDFTIAEVHSLSVPAFAEVAA